MKDIIMVFKSPKNWIVLRITEFEKELERRKLYQKIPFLFIISNWWEDIMEGKESIHSNFTNINCLGLDLISVLNLHEENCKL